ncbi:MAG TPA: DUF427 domain-containing protein [Caulobacteraceae bacterium]|nr:DUF427 domain-containing protein [Caulobacteraceae bacterium]
MDVIKVPGPDHPITITPLPGRVRALYQGHEIADSADAVVLREASYPPVVYFPRADVEMDVLARTELDTYCPYKGHASYFTIRRDGTIAENGVWSYETPHPGMAAIAERVAFYPNVVTIEGLDEPAVARASAAAAAAHAAADTPNDRL